MKKHWAAPLIGLPWQPGAEGPKAFDCWGLVRHVFRVRYGIEMPDVQRGDFAEGGVATIKQAAQVSGWRRVYDSEAEDGDIVLMRSTIDGKRHVGVMVESSKGLRLLHADGYLSRRGPVGSVVAVPLHDALTEGYEQSELWRKT